MNNDMHRREDDEAARERADWRDDPVYNDEPMTDDEVMLLLDMADPVEPTVADRMSIGLRIETRTGGHATIGVFVGKPGCSRGKAGTLTLSLNELDDFLTLIAGSPDVAVDQAYVDGYAAAPGGIEVYSAC